MKIEPTHPTPNESLQPAIAPRRLPHIPRISIRYLLAWTAATAVVLVVFTRGLGTTNDDALTVALLALSAMGVGWLYLGGLLILYHATQKTLWPLEPGEWVILVAINVLTVLGVMGLVGTQLAYRSWFGFLVGFVPAQFAIASLVPAISQRRRRIWSALFWTLALACLSFYPVVLLDNYVSMSITMLIVIASAYLGGFSSLLLGLLVTGVLTDWRRRDARHWLHWSAIVPAGLALTALVGLAIVTIVMQILYG